MQSVTYLPAVLLVVGGGMITILLTRFLEAKPGTWPGDVEIGSFFVPLGRIILIAAVAAFATLVLAGFES